MSLGGASPGGGSLSLVMLIGSLRQDSHNRVVGAAMVELLGERAAVAEVDLGPVPFFDADVEAAGDPPPVTALKDAVTGADGLIIVTPEYNLGVPAVVKNAIDWLSRLPGQSALTGAAVGVVAGTVGNHEAAGVRGHLSDSLSRIAGHFHPPTLGLGRLGHRIENGMLTDDEARQALATWLDGFVAHVEAVRAPST